MISLLKHHGIKKTQKEVDFLIPYLDIDRRYFFDPALLRFSTTEELQPWKEEIEEFLKFVNAKIKAGDKKKLEGLLNIGEANNIGLGYCIEDIDGSGFGEEISKKVIAIISRSKHFKVKGFSRLEELQWLDASIGPDRVSDFGLNILKRNIIKYTQEQCRKHGIPMEKVRVDKVFYGDTVEWGPMVEELPVNPLKKSKDPMNPHPAILLLPKELIRPLPLFLSYDDMYGFMEAEKRIKSLPDGSRVDKSEVVAEIMKTPAVSAAYISKREAEKDKLTRPDFDSGVFEKLEQLDEIETGRKDAHKYRALVADLMSEAFKGSLRLFAEEKPTLLGDKQRDIIFQNVAKSGIFADLRIETKCSHVVVDAKNTEDVTAKDVARVASYLNQDIGMVGIIVSRKKADKSLLRQAKAFLNDDKKFILFVSDEDFRRWLRGSHKIKQIDSEAVSTSDPLTTMHNRYSDLVSS